MDGAASYAIQVSTSPTFSSTVVNASVTTPYYTPAIDLPRATTLYWRAQAKGANPSAWSRAFKFTVANLP